MTSCTVSQLQFFIYQFPPPIRNVLACVILVLCELGRQLSNANTSRRDSLHDHDSQFPSRYPTPSPLPFCPRLHPNSLFVYLACRISRCIPHPRLTSVPHRHHSEAYCTHLVPDSARAPSPAPHTLEACKNVQNLVDALYFDTVTWHKRT